MQCIYLPFYDSINIRGDKMKKFFSIILLGVSLIFLSSCATTNPTIESNVKYLTSDELNGRLTGTDGCKKTELYLKEELKRMKLAPYDKDYMVFYYHNFFDPEKQIHDISAVSNDSTTTFQYGKDYIEYSCGDIDKNFKLTFDKKSFTNDNILVLKDQSLLSGVNLKGKVVFIKANDILSTKKTLKKKDFLANNIITISENMYNFLETNKNSSVKIKFVNSYEPMKVNNVIGKIKGKDNSKALILSAHFDHVGSTGDKIYRGAFDNANGVALLLDVAKQLKERYKTTPPERDILICFFNGEESGLQGSKAFVETRIKDYTQLSNINIDTIGLKNGGPLSLLYPEGAASNLIKDLETYFKSKDYEVQAKVNNGLVSDHFSFSNKNIASVNLGQEKIDTIHTLEDLTNTLDFQYTNKLSLDLYRFITEHLSKDYSIDKSAQLKKGNEDDDFSTYQKKYDSIEETLEPYQYIKVDTMLVRKLNSCFSRSSSRFPFESIKNYYPILKPTLNVGKFKLDSISLSEGIGTDLDNIEENKIYTKKPTINDVYQFLLTYSDTENNIININCFIDPIISNEHPTFSLESQFKIKEKKKIIKGYEFNYCDEKSKIINGSTFSYSDKNMIPDKALYRQETIGNKTIHMFITSEKLNLIDNLDWSPVLESIKTSFK